MDEPSPSTPLRRPSPDELEAALSPWRSLGLDIRRRLETPHAQALLAWARVRKGWSAMRPDLEILGGRPESERELLDLFFAVATTPRGEPLTTLRAAVDTLAAREREQRRTGERAAKARAGRAAGAKRVSAALAATRAQAERRESRQVERAATDEDGHLRSVREIARITGIDRRKVARLLRIDEGRGARSTDMIRPAGSMRPCTTAPAPHSQSASAKPRRSSRSTAASRSVR